MVFNAGRKYGNGRAAVVAVANARGSNVVESGSVVVDGFVEVEVCIGLERVDDEDVEDLIGLVLDDER